MNGVFLLLQRFSNQKLCILFTLVACALPLKVHAIFLKSIVTNTAQERYDEIPFQHEFIPLNNIGTPALVTYSPTINLALLAQGLPSDGNSGFISFVFSTLEAGANFGLILAPADSTNEDFGFFRVRLYEGEVEISNSPRFSVPGCNGSLGLSTNGVGSLRLTIGWRRTLNGTRIYYAAQPTDGSPAFERQCDLPSTVDIGPAPQFGPWSMNVQPSGLYVSDLIQAQFQWGALDVAANRTVLSPSGENSVAQLQITYSDDQTETAVSPSEVDLTFAPEGILTFDPSTGLLIASGTTGEVNVRIRYSPEEGSPVEDELSLFVNDDSNGQLPTLGSDGCGGEEDPAPLQTFYVSPNGSGSGCSAQSPCNFSTAISQATPGTHILLNPGSYGSFTKVSGALGSDSHPVVIRRNPATTSARPQSWYSQVIPQGTPTTRPQFSGMRFGPFETNGIPNRFHLILDDLDIIDGGFFLDGYVAGIEARRINFHGELTDFSATSTGFALYQKHSYGKTEIKLCDSYVHGMTRPFHFAGETFGSGIQIIGNSVSEVNSTVFSLSYLQGNVAPILIEGNFVRKQRSLADTEKNTVTIQQVISPTQFVIASQNGPVNYPDFLVIDGQSRAITSFPSGSSSGTVTISSSFPFAVSAGITATIWDGVHGSTAALRGSLGSIGLYFLRNILAAHGSSRTIYNYTNTPVNIHMEGNLIYAPYNRVGTIDLGLGVAAGSVFRNNTITGIVDGLPGNLTYGIGVNISAAGPIEFTNNLVVGSVGISGSSGSLIQRNIAYASSSLNSASSGNNSQNITYYSGSGSAPLPFTGSGNFFAGDALGYFDLWNFASGRNTNALLFNPMEAFRPLQHTPACSGSIEIGALPCL